MWRWSRGGWDRLSPFRRRGAKDRSDRQSTALLSQSIWFLSLSNRSRRSSDGRARRLGLRSRTARVSSLELELLLHRRVESRVLGPNSRSGRSLLIASVGWECTSPRGRKDRRRVSTSSRLVLWSPGTLRFRLLVTCVILVAASASAGLVLKDRGVWHDRSVDTLRQRPQLHRRRPTQPTSITTTSRRHDLLLVVPVGRGTRSRLVPMFRHSLAFTLIVADKYEIGVARFGLDRVARRFWLGRPSGCIRSGKLELGIGSLGELWAMV